MKKTGRIILYSFAVGWLIKEIFLPVGVAMIYSNEFMELANKCDTAMEADWYYSQKREIDRRSNITQLLVCHEYDKTRKVLLMSGVPEEYLAWLGLQSLELYQKSPEEYIKKHRFTER